MNTTDNKTFRKPAAIFIKALAFVAVIACVLGLGASFVIKAKPDQLQTVVSSAQHTSATSTQRGSHAARAASEKSSSVALLQWGGLALLCAGAFFGIARRIHSTFGVKENAS